MTESHFWYEPAYRALFDALPANGDGAIWVEVGVYEGAAIKWLAQQELLHQRGVAIYAVDDFRGWPGVKQGEALYQAYASTAAPYLPHFNLALFTLRCDSITAAMMFGTQSCDVVWLDADHSYEAVKADIAAWWPKVRPGGALGGDDWAYREGGVQRAVEEAFPTERIHLINGEREGEIWPSWIVRKPV